MININEINGNCSGCSACTIVCPVNAVKYIKNDEGFFVADVDKQKCIHCGMCTRVCNKQIQTKNLKKLTEGQLFSAYTKNIKDLKDCTSGGIAFELAKKGIEKGYIVSGTIYNYQENIAETVLIKNIQELEKTKNSKYIQSKCDTAYKKIIDLCKKNEKIKFMIFGTPCQIYGIRKSIEFLKLKNDFVYIELFCHGVPSYLVWERYLNEEIIRSNNKIEQINFRDKKLGWHNYVLTVKYENKKQKINKAERDNFYKIFFDNILLNKSCMDCKLRREFSDADIRLGDYWGKKYKNNIKGVSAVEVFSQKGIEIFESIQKNIIYKKEKKEDLLELLKIQNAKEYKNLELYTKTMQKLKTDKSLNKIIKNYRKKLNKKYILKQKVKVCISYLPNCFKNILRKIL